MNNKEKEEQLRIKVFIQIYDQVYDQVCNQAQFQIREQVEDRTFNQIRVLLDVAIDDPIVASLCSQITSERSKQKRGNGMKNKSFDAVWIKPKMVDHSFFMMVLY
jgi:hypothetical protein